MIKKLITGLLTVGLLMSPTVSLAHEQRPAERKLTVLINRARANRDIRTLDHGIRLHKFGRRQVERMIDADHIFHGNPPLFCGEWGQAVGVTAGTPRSIFRAFMNSPAHRSIILDRDFRRLGVGARRTGGLLWVAFEFCA